MATITLNVPSGVSIIGNFTTEDQPIDGNVSIEVSEMKTTDNGVWKSWQAGLDPAFQGFDTMLSSHGYVVVATDAGTVDLPGALTFDMMNADIVDADVNVVSLPYDGVDVDWRTGRYDVQFFKTLDNGIWKSWQKGADPAFQGFTKFEKGKGYVTVAETVREKDNDMRTDTYYPMFYFGGYEFEFLNFTNPLLKDVVIQGERYQLA